MLEQYFVRPETVDRIRSSWIGDPIEQYVRWLTEHCYAARNVFRRVPILVKFGEFARQRGATTWDELPSHVEAFVEFWVRGHGRGSKTEEARKKVAGDVRNPVRQMLSLAIPGFTGTRPRKWAFDPFTEVAPGFFTYLREERGLRETSVLHYVYHLRKFESYLKKLGFNDLCALSPPVLSGFLTEASRELVRTGVQARCATLRVFLRYLHREGILANDPGNSLESPHLYRLSTVPRSISWDDVRRMLAAVDRRTPIGKRDYAMLLLLVTYGLRGHEVAALRLDDIDWRSERLRIPERKAGHSTAYPLSPVVGAAVLDYLKHGRPQTPERRLFFRSIAPYRPISHGTVSLRATRYLRRAGIQVPRPGSHTLRHTCVQRLVDADFPLKTIGDYVGHRVPASTQIYAKVAIEALREVACGDGEEIL